MARSSNRRATSVAKNARWEEHLERDVSWAMMVYHKHGKGRDRLATGVAKSAMWAEHLERDAWAMTKGDMFCPRRGKE